MQFDLTAKLNLAKQLLLEEFSHNVSALLVMGSITKEATHTSDIDVAVVYGDEYHRENFEDIKSKLPLLSSVINSRFPAHELVLWPSKLDHYRTFLPDVSYLRANLPSSIDRLDAWCGLAKHTLLNYEASSCHVIYGDFTFATLIGRIPRREANELFLLATRTLAEGLAERESESADARRSALNHISKAGLRAAYSVLIRHDCEPRNSYRDIADASLKYLPEKYHGLLTTLYEVKTGGESLEPPLRPLLEFLRYCELQISDTAMLEMVGLAKASAGESFAFPAETIWNEYAPSEQYRRFAGFKKNYLQSVYFLMTAQEIIHRFSVAGVTDCEQLDFYFEELTTLASFSAFSPGGLRLVVGQEERETIFLKLGFEFLKELTPQLVALASGYLNNPNEFSGSPWIFMEEKIARTHLLLSQLSQIKDLSCPEELADSLASQVSEEALLNSVEWQGLLFHGIYSQLILGGYSDIALSLYQAGKTNLAQKLLKSIVSTRETKEWLARELGIDPTDFSSRIGKELSRATQYYALTFHRQGDYRNAREEYLRALELDPDNHSALDDFATLLMEHAPGDETVTFLDDLLKGFTEHKAEARRQLANTYMAYAIARKKNREWSAAETWYLRAIETDPEYEKLYYNFGILKQQQMEDPATALELYRKAIDLNPLYVKPYVNVGRILEEKQDFAGAINVLNEAVRRDIADEYVFANLGNCYWRVRQLADAARCYESALKLKENHADALNGMGVILLERRDASDIQSLIEAAQFFNKAYEADPPFEGAKDNLLTALALLRNVTAPADRMSVTSGHDIETRESAYHSFLEQAQILRALAKTEEYCRQWLALLREARESSWPEYEYYQEEFVLNLGELHVEAMCSKGGAGEWQKVLSNLAGDASPDPSLLSAIQFFESLARSDYQGARDSIRSQPLERVLVSTFLTARKGDT